VSESTTPTNPNPPGRRPKANKEDYVKIAVVLERSLYANIAWLAAHAGLDRSAYITRILKTQAEHIQVFDTSREPRLWAQLEESVADSRLASPPSQSRLVNGQGNSKPGGTHHGQSGKRSA
jgi:hypothetical protein